MSETNQEFVNCDKMLLFRNKVIEDLRVRMKYYRPAQKDICIVVHNGLEYIQGCLDSIAKNTDSREPYTIRVWDNASEKPTRDYLIGKAMSGEIEYYRSVRNLGFIEPANEIASVCESQYIVMLNSDTIVLPGWDEALLSQLQRDPELAQVGFQGGILNEKGVGYRAACGYDVDYIDGWCFAVRKEDCCPGPLFDSKNLRFAYGEDSDLSLRFREKGRKVYALHLDLVYHYGNKTVLEVAKDGARQEIMIESFKANHEYLRRRWADYLAHDRFDLHRPLKGL